MVHSPQVPDILRNQLGSMAYKYAKNENDQGGLSACEQITMLESAALHGLGGEVCTGSPVGNRLLPFCTQNAVTYSLHICVSGVVRQPRVDSATASDENFLRDEIREGCTYGMSGQR